MVQVRGDDDIPEGWKINMHPLTVDRLNEMKKEFNERFPPSCFDKAADMSQPTWDALKKLLGNDLTCEKSRLSWFYPNRSPFIGIEVHIVPSIPFGEVEPCRCKERQFRKDFIEGMETVQALKKEEDK